MPAVSPAGLSDLHVHSQFSCDSRSSMEAICRRAVELGLRSIAFTDHLDLVPADPCAGFYRPAAYQAELARCRALFDGRLTIRGGVEVGEIHWFEREIAALLAEHPYDLVIGSVHWVDGYLVFDPAFFQTRSMEDASRAYFAELLRMCQHGGFDVLGHLDIVKRFGAAQPDGFAAARYEPEIRAVLAALVEGGIGLELNTSTLRRPVAQTSPTPAVLRWYRELGGELLTLGSDAHHPDDLAAGFAAAIEMVRSAGFGHLADYERRTPRLVPLEDLA